MVSLSVVFDCNPVDCGPPGSSVHRILQARVLEWVVIPSPEDLPDSGIESLAWQASSLPLAPSEKPLYQAKCLQNVQVTVLEMEAIWETVLI